MHAVEGGFYGLVGSTGYLAATAVDPVLGAVAISADKYQSLLTENPKMDHGAAWLLASVDGAAQSAANGLQLKVIAGRSPGLASALTGLAPSVDKYLAHAAVSTVDANLSQAGGDLVSLTIDQLAPFTGGQQKALSTELDKWAEARGDMRQP